MKRIDTYVKSNCTNNGLKNSIGRITIVYLLDNTKCINIIGSVKYTTNIKMEMEACIQALNCIPLEKRHETIMTIYTDSTLILNGINNKWVDDWKKHRWRTKRGTEVANKEQWILLIELMKDFGGVMFTPIDSTNQTIISLLDTNLEKKIPPNGLLQKELIAIPKQ